VADFIGERKLPAVAASDSVATAVKEMKHSRSDCVLVLEGGQAVGIFTERDFLDRVAGSLNPADTPIGDVMTTRVETLSPQDCVSYAINKMAVGGFRNVPIVERGQAVAVLSVRDVMAHLFDLFVEASERESKEITPWTDLGGG
jgi:CBS domain-containing protein